MLANIGRKIILGIHENTIALILRRNIYRRMIDSFENEDKYKEHLKNEKLKKRRKGASKQTKLLKETTEVQQPEIDEEFNTYSDIPQEILNLKFTKPNPAKIGSFSNLMLNMKSRSYRERHNACLLEGKFLIADAMKSGMFVRSLYFSRLQNLVGLPVDLLPKINLIKVGFKEIQQASEVKVQTDGLLAIASKQDEITRKKVISQRNELLHENDESLLPLTLVCDNIRDAGNMGTILRGAAAAGCEQVITTKGCVDIWDSKVIRAGAGAHFKIPIEHSLTWDEVGEALQKFDIQNVQLSHHSAENMRLSELVTDFRRFKEDSEFYKELTGDMNIKDNDVTINNYKNVIFESKPYYDVTYEKGHTVVIIGGEVHGVSADACQFALEATKAGKRKVEGYMGLINIPMFVGSDCLNTAVAASIILFDARRKMLIEMN
ncbi:rRNA methyltransferase 3, mitochondrial-like [Styela clava]